MTKASTFSRLDIYTDGSYFPLDSDNVRSGFGFIITDENGVCLEKGNGALKAKSSVRAELYAIVRALRIASKYHAETICVHTDYKGVVLAMNDNQFNWSIDDFGKMRSSKGRLIKHSDLWKQIWNFCKTTKVTFTWIKGHDGNVYNMYCDLLARTGAELVA